MAIINVDRFSEIGYRVDVDTKQFIMQYTLKDGSYIEESVDLIVDGKLNPECEDFVGDLKEIKEIEAKKAAEREKEAKQKVLSFEERVEQITPEDIEVLNDYFMNGSTEAANKMDEIMEKYNMTEADLKTAQLFLRNKTVEQVVTNYNEQFNQNDAPEMEETRTDTNSGNNGNSQEEPEATNDGPEATAGTTSDTSADANAQEEPEATNDGPEATAGTEGDTSADANAQEEPEATNDGPEATAGTTGDTSADANVQEETEEQEQSYTEQLLNDPVRRKIFDIEQKLTGIVKSKVKGEELEEALEKIAKEEKVSIDGVRKIYDKTVANERVRKRITGSKILIRTSLENKKAKIISLNSISKENPAADIINLSGNNILEAFREEWKEYVTYSLVQGEKETNKDVMNKAANMALALNIMSKAGDGDTIGDIRKYIKKAKKENPNLDVKEAIKLVTAFSPFGKQIARNTRTLYIKLPEKIALQKESLKAKIPTEQLEKFKMVGDQNTTVRVIKKEISRFVKEKASNVQKKVTKVTDAIHNKLTDNAAIRQGFFDELGAPIRRIKYEKDDEEIKKLQELRAQIIELRENGQLEAPEITNNGRTI